MTSKDNDSRKRRMTGNRIKHLIFVSKMQILFLLMLINPVLYAQQASIQGRIYDAASNEALPRITSYNVCYTKLLR